MKIKNILSVAFLLLTAITVSAQFSFSVTPGLNLNGARIGYRFGHFEPSISFQFLRVSVNQKETGQRSGSNGLENYTDNWSVTGAVYLPSAGVKYLFSPVGTINSYLKVNIIKPILAGNSTHNGVAEDSDYNDANKTSILGTQLGFGVEHYFSSHFSIGGEFGLTYFRIRTKNSYDTMVYDSNSESMKPVTITNKQNVVINPTYALISLNYYFSKKAKQAPPATPEG